MQFQIQFNYYFPSESGLFNQVWEISGVYERTEHPCRDLEGDLSNTPDVEEYFTIRKIEDVTLGYSAGFLNPRLVSRDHLHEIVRLGYLSGHAQIEKLKHEQRTQCKRNTAAVGHIR